MQQLAFIGLHGRKGRKIRRILATYNLKGLGKMFCSECGTKNEAQGAYCSGCGFAFSGSQKQNTPASEPTGEVAFGELIAMYFAAGYKQRKRSRDERTVKMIKFNPIAYVVQLLINVPLLILGIWLILFQDNLLGIVPILVGFVISLSLQQLWIATLILMPNGAIVQTGNVLNKR